MKPYFQPRALSDFAEIWLADFEFSQPVGEVPTPICLVAREHFSGKTVKLFGPEFPNHAPFDTGPKSLFVAFAAQAELGCFLQLGWPAPTHVIDLYCEFRIATIRAGERTQASLVHALRYFGSEHQYADEKEALRRLAQRSFPFSISEATRLLDYCASDVDALDDLLCAMSGRLDVPRALVRGQFCETVAAIERRGIPIAPRTWKRLLRAWPSLKTAFANLEPLAAAFFNGSLFRFDKFRSFVESNFPDWPRTPNGKPSFRDEVLKTYALRSPVVASIARTRANLNVLKRQHAAVGHDGRNRCSVRPFATQTGRNAPRSSEFLLNGPKWLRGLIRPSRGNILVYFDWAQQELGIAAACSEDRAMLDAYESGDLYLWVARKSGLVAPDSSNQYERQLREKVKVAVLALSYGGGEERIGTTLGCSSSDAAHLVAAVNKAFPRWEAWRRAQIDRFDLHEELQTVLGWKVGWSPLAKPTSTLNFTCQAQGAEMLRLAATFAHRAGVGTCALHHDALLVESPVKNLGYTLKRTKAAMARASRAVLNGFELRIEATVIRSSETLLKTCKEKDIAMWEAVGQQINAAA